MPNEIPDSDGESDYESGPGVLARALLAKVRNSPNAGDREFDVNFDDFISQTQSIKDEPSQLEQTKRGTASTQKHLRDALEVRGGSASSNYDGADDTCQSAEDAQVPTTVAGQRKRAYSEIGEGHDQRGSSQNQMKRTKTYGAGRPSFAPTKYLEAPFKSANVDQTAFSSVFAARSSSQAPQEQDEEEDVVSQARNRPMRVISLLDDSASNAGHVLSMSNSSMGGYQSYNLDFRGSGSGLHVATNPFGALSQVSVDASVEHAAEGRRADLSSTVPLSASPRRPGRDAISPLTDVESGIQTTAEISASINPSVLAFGQPEESQMLTSQVAITTLGQSASTFSTTSYYDLGKAQAEDENVSNHIQRASSSEKRAQKCKSSRQPSVASRQDMVTDHQDDDAHAIGLPKDQYKPRPSKPRSGTIEPEQQSQHAQDEPPAKRKGRKKSIKSGLNAIENGSLAKLPTSELNLSDEAIIGLPKENYKPRPTRRRSRMIVEEAEASINIDAGNVESKDSYEQQRQSQQTEQREPSQALEAAEAPTPKPKKGKKAKLKRAKTSAAGLLKKSEPMISDGEEDVVWVDSKPAKVKLDLPADPLFKRAVKEERSADQTVAVEAQLFEKSVEVPHESSKESQSTRSKTVTVEIPARAEKENLEPKKRGRKSEAVTVGEEEDGKLEINEPATSTLAAHPPPSSPPQPAISSTILKEKGANASLQPPTPKKQTESSSPIKPAKTTHSPINPRGGKVLYRVGLSRRSAIPSLLKMVKPPAKQQAEKENFDEDGKPVDLVAETMKKWREMGVLD